MDLEDDFQGLKAGARNSSADIKRLRRIKQMVGTIADLLDELGTPDEDEDEEALPAEDTNIVFMGSAVKSLGEGRVGGYLIRFTDSNSPDVTGEFFTKDTNFELADDGLKRTAVYYNHGLDRTVGRKKIGEGKLEITDEGVWIEAQLNLRTKYEQAIYKLAQAGKLGWSSGTLPNLIEREFVGKSAHIKYWPLGIDASLTPTPAAGLTATTVVSLKSYAEEWDFVELDDVVTSFKAAGDFEVDDNEEDDSVGDAKVAPKVSDEQDTAATSEATRLQLELDLLALEM